MKNLGHPTAEQLISKRSEWLESPQQYSRRFEYGREVSEEEFKRDQYLWTMYRYEIDNNLTILDYDEWIIETINRNTQLRRFIHRTGLLDNDRENVIEFLCSKKLSLMSCSNNLTYQLIDPYGEEYFSDRKDCSKETEEKATNILLIGYQNLFTAIKAFDSVCDNQVSLTYVYACDERKYEKMEKVMSRIDKTIVPPGTLFTIKGTEFSEREDRTAMYIKRYTKSRIGKRLF